MPVDAGTSVDEVEHGARIVAAIDRGVTLFLTPLSEPASTRLTIGASDLERFQAAASRHLPDVRVLPQLHKVLGIL
jgi:organic radical activating enzyme